MTEIGCYTTVAFPYLYNDVKRTLYEISYKSHMDPLDQSASTAT